MKTSETTGLFTSALHVMNEALDKNRDKTPYKQIIDALDRAAEGERFGVAIYEDDPEAPFDFYTIAYRNGQLELVEHGKGDTAVNWKTPRSYLRELVDNRKEYIENPAKMDWDWVKARFGLDL
jgi:hypothetical protein